MENVNRLLGGSLGDRLYGRLNACLDERLHTRLSNRLYERLGACLDERLDTRLLDRLDDRLYLTLKH